MGYQSKTWSLSDEVVAEIERRVREMKARTGSSSPNRVLLELLATPPAFTDDFDRAKSGKPEFSTVRDTRRALDKLNGTLADDLDDFNQRRQETRPRIKQGARRTPREKGDGKR